MLTLYWLRMFRFFLSDLFVDLVFLKSVLYILKNRISSHDFWFCFLIFLSIHFSYVSLLCRLSLLLWFWRILRMLLWKSLSLSLIRFFLFFLFFPLLKFSLLFNGEITVYTLQIFVQFFTFCLVMLCLRWLWLYPDVGFQRKVCFFGWSLALIYGRINFSLAHRWMTNICGSIDLFWLLDSSHFCRVYFCRACCLIGCNVCCCVCLGCSINFDCCVFDYLSNRGAVVIYLVKGCCQVVSINKFLTTEILVKLLLTLWIEVLTRVLVHLFVKLHLGIRIELFRVLRLLLFILLNIFLLCILVTSLQILVKFCGASLILWREWLIHIHIHLFVGLISLHFFLHVEVGCIYLIILFWWVVLAHLIVLIRMAMTVVMVMAMALSGLKRWCQREL